MNGDVGPGGAGDIRQEGDPVLRTRTEPVVDFGPALDRLVERMFAVMYDADGVGLAANQIGVALSVFVYDVQGRRGVLVNPTGLTLAGPVEVEQEGCLSVRGLSFDTPRSVFASVRGQGVDGEAVVLEGEGLFARCLQHEHDHLQGRLYLDRLTGSARRQARAQLAGR